MAVDVLLCASPRYAAALEHVGGTLINLRVSVAFDADLPDLLARDAAAREARVILVGWSDDCFAHGGDISGAVRRCAAIGRKRGVLLPVLMEPTALDQPWNQMPPKSLIAWAQAKGQGAEAAEEWRSVLKALGSAIGRPGLADYGSAAERGLVALDQWARRHPADPLAQEVLAKTSVIFASSSARGVYEEDDAPSSRVLAKRRLRIQDLAKPAAGMVGAFALMAGAVWFAGELEWSGFGPLPAAAAPEESPMAREANRGAGGAVVSQVRQIWDEMVTGFGSFAPGGAGETTNGFGGDGGAAQAVVMHGQVRHGRVPASRAAPPPTPEELANAGPLIILDVRSVRRDAPAPVVRVPSRLPDFSVFRECEACPEMVVLPAGSFLMGSPANEVGRGEDEDDQAGPGGAQVRVSLPRFAIARYETTWEEWRACVAAGVCDNAAIVEAGADNGWGWGRRPMIEVNGDQEPSSFARWVSELTGGPYRLPTEAEWEYAAKAGTSTPFPWGDAIGREHANYGADECCAAHAEGRDDWMFTAPVGSFPANPWGLHDMHGNVMEWVEDCYRANLGQQPSDGAAYVGGACTSRVLRGGSWDYMPQDLRSAYRFRLNPERRFNFIGFRLARSL